MVDWKDLLSTFNTVVPRKGEDRQSVPGFCRDKMGMEEGILFTDTSILAGKFGVSQVAVENVINDFIIRSGKLGRKWILLDMSSNQCRRYLQYDHSWQAYHQCLYETCKNNQWETGVSTNLMIVGGNDVIAVPQKVFSVAFRDYLAEIDFWYCFPRGVDVIDEMIHYVDICNEFNSKEVYEHLVSCAKFSVARIPLPEKIVNGELTLENSLQFYFDKALESSQDSSLYDVCLASAGEFKTASYIISYGLPLVCRDDRFSKQKVYLAPPINVDRNSSGVQRMEYVSDLKSADCLFFNCHGDERPQWSGYYSNQGGLFTLFDTHLPDSVFRNKLFLTCACFGARYLHSTKNESILLKTLYDSSTVIFAGSSIVAKGGLDCAAFSENFLRVYLDYIVEGYSAGEAFMRAKLAYLSLYFYADSGIEDMRLTLDEFNLFGDPSIKYTAEDEWHLFPTLEPIPNLTMKGGSQGKSQFQSVLDAVYYAARESVDAAFDDIAVKLGHRIESEYSLSEVKLRSIQKKTVSGREVGYRFIYSYDCGYTGSIEALTDTEGKTERLIISK